MTVDLDVVASLDDINTVEHVKKTLAFDGHRQFVIEHVQEDVRSTWVWGCDGKVVDLAFEDDTIAINCAQIETRFMHGWCETKFSKDLIHMLFPQARGFRVALHANSTGITCTSGIGGRFLWFIHHSLKALSGRT